MSDPDEEKKKKKEEEKKKKEEDEKKKRKQDEEDNSYMPAVPRMGGIKSGQHNVAWTGGTPNVDWNNGLLQPNP